MSWTNRKRVVVPIDFSDNSAPAVRAAMDFVKDRSDIKAIHVLMPLDYVSPGVAWGNVNNETREDAVKAHLDAFVKKHELDGITTTVRFGNPGLEIADYAAAINADLVVIPSHGHHGFKRLLLGSVAESVVRHVDCPVLVLRRDDAD